MGPEEQLFAAGDVIAGRYRIEEELGRGAYGVVFRAIQLGIGRAVALKTLLPGVGEEAEERQRFEREALLISRLNHPNIITLFDYGEHEGVRFMVMEYVEGKSLGDLIAERGRLSAAAARRIVDQMLDALHLAHAQGVVHRDLKPENIRILAGETMDGEGVEVVKILDFGIAKIVQPQAEVPSMLDRLTESGKAMGTPQYMSPENITGDPVTHKADLYAVGLILFEMLAGEAAFKGKTPREVMVSHVRDDAPMLPDEEELRPFARALAAALIKQPDDRVASARAMRVMLEQDGAGRPSGALLAAGAGAGAAERSTMRALVAVALGVAVVVVLMAVALLMQTPGETGVETTSVVAASEREDGAETPSPNAAREGFEAAVVEPQPRPTPGEGEGEEVEPASEVDVGELQVQNVEQRADVPEPRDDGAESPEVARRSLASGADAYHAPSRARRVRAQPEREELTRLVRLVSTPPGARVSANGQPLGTTPLSWEAPLEGAVRLNFSLIGYQDQEVSLSPESAEDEVEVTLRRARLELMP
ncbi:protein kinase [Lujinxingia vulgaris]|uniref:Protein kinase n=1 Tax=Lujinxingia vulgaris TaxID=2600176 RepID=A0A5C6XL91_9DELT|nr:serine/threonine-protein kinase [Lujinxingia vulgaris]TXD38104.1 protein kinase [Lujinxingia vulgaris]